MPGSSAWLGVQFEGGNAIYSAPYGQINFRRTFMEYNFITWNMQGASEDEDGFIMKRAVLQSNLVPDALNIIALQEVGSPESSPLLLEGIRNGKVTIKNTIKSYNFKVGYIEDQMAKQRGLRCTEMLLVEDVVGVTISKFGTLPLGGGTRPLLYATVHAGDKGILFGCKHAIADSSQAVLEVKQDIAELIKSKCNFIIGGDFNCNHTNFASLESKGIYVYTDGKPTQGVRFKPKTNLYDYFISNIKLIRDHYHESSGAESLSSDHNPAVLQFEL